MLAFTLSSSDIKICTSGSLKVPCVDVSMQISHSQATSAIFTAVEVRLERINLVHRQAKARMPHRFSVLRKMRTDKGKEKTKEITVVLLQNFYLFCISFLQLSPRAFFFCSSFAHSVSEQSVVPEENPLSKSMLMPNPWERAHVLSLYWKQKGVAESRVTLISQSLPHLQLGGKASLVMRISPKMVERTETRKGHGVLYCHPIFCQEAKQSRSILWQNTCLRHCRPPSCSPSSLLNVLC